VRVEISNIKEFNTMLLSKYNLTTINPITGLTIDSRLVKNGDIFIPLNGHNVDGHKFINNAIKSGASLVLSEKNNHINSEKIKYVNSTYNSLQDISKKWREYFSGNIIGITGSNGKTTTKELLANILSGAIKCNYSKENYNSTTGVPLSIIGMDKDSDVYVIELGMSQPGEINTLCNIANPNIGLITNISGAHIKYFGSLENIAKEKSSLFLSLSENDTAFYNIDDPFIKKIPTKAKKISYSLIKNADYQGTVEKSVNGSNYLLINNKFKMRLPYNADFFAYNALAAFSIADYLNINTKTIIKKIEKFQNLPGRNKIFKHSGCIIIDDTYNSNLESAKSGILNLSNYSPNHRCIAVVSDMLELGKQSIPYHKKLGKFISKLNIDVVFGIGKLTKNTIDILKSTDIKTYFFNNKEDLSIKLEKFIKKNDVIYFKASRGMYLETIIKRVFK